MMEQNRGRRFTFAVVTMSDKGSRGERQDTSGPYLCETLAGAGYEKVLYAMIPDSVERIVSLVRELADVKKVSLVLTTGGTGVAPTDVTPEAMLQVIDKEIPGIAEMMRLASLEKTPNACLSRGKAGIRGTTLIVNLPGSLKAVRENLAILLPVLSHALEKIHGDEGDCGR
ncbi:MAG: molybdenum cofactor biosynthesis protein B [Desulfopila sp.]